LLQATLFILKVGFCTFRPCLVKLGLLNHITKKMRSLMACHNSKTILHWMPAAWHTTSSSTSTTHGILACDVSCVCWPLRSAGTACHIRNVLASQIFNNSAARYGSTLNTE